MSKYYVYALVNPMTKRPFYIGKGKGRRCFCHLRETEETTTNIYKYRVIQKLREGGVEPNILILKSCLAEKDAYEWEEFLIMFFGRKRYDEGGILTNLCLSSRPPVNDRGCSPQTGRTLDEYYGSERADEIRRKISESMRGENNPFFGRKHSPDAKRKMAKAASVQWKGKRKSPQQVENMKRSFTAERREALRSNRIEMNKSLNTPERVEELKNRNKNLGREKTKQTVASNFDMYKTILGYLMDGMSVRDAYRHLGVSEHAVYQLVWKVNKKIEYYQSVVEEIERGE